MIPVFLFVYLQEKNEMYIRFCLSPANGRFGYRLSLSVFCLFVCFYFRLLLRKGFWHLIRFPCISVFGTNEVGKRTGIAELWSTQVVRLPDWYAITQSRAYLHENWVESGSRLDTSTVQEDCRDKTSRSHFHATSVKLSDSPCFLCVFFSCAFTIEELSSPLISRRKVFFGVLVPVV